jgi:hypothetical protein
MVLEIIKTKDIMHAFPNLYMKSYVQTDRAALRYAALKGAAQNSAEPS